MVSDDAGDEANASRSNKNFRTLEGGENENYQMGVCVRVCNGDRGLYPYRLRAVRALPYIRQYGRRSRVQVKQG